MRLCPAPACPWEIYDQNIKTIKEITPEQSLWCSDPEFLHSPATAPAFPIELPFRCCLLWIFPREGIAVGKGEWECFILQKCFFWAICYIQCIHYHTFLTVLLFSVLNSSSWRSFKTVKVWCEPSPCPLLTTWHKQKASSKEPSVVTNRSTKIPSRLWKASAALQEPSEVAELRCQLYVCGCTSKGCKYWWSCCWFNSQPKHWLPAVPRAFPLQ